MRCLVGSQGRALLRQCVATVIATTPSQYISEARRYVYWPPPASKRSRLIELPSGKKFFVFMGKRDADGKLEPVVCFIDRNGDRLTWLNSEELHQLEQLAPRLERYFDLWEQKQHE